MAQFADPPAIVQVQPDMPVIRPQMQEEAEKLQQQLKATVAHTTTLARRGQEQARRVVTMEERTRETLRELMASVGREDGDNGQR